MRDKLSDRAKRTIHRLEDLKRESNDMLVESDKLKKDIRKKQADTRYTIAKIDRILRGYKD